MHIRGSVLESVSSLVGNTLQALYMLCAGACFKDQGIQYTCVAGHLVAGNKDSAKRTLAKYACNSYREVCCQLQPEGNSCTQLS